MSEYTQEHGAFDMYFASLASLQFHPGANTREHTALTLEQCRDKAVEMVKLRRETLPLLNGES